MHQDTPVNSVIAEFKKDLDKVANYKGGRLEQLLMIFFKQTKIRYNKLTQKEKQQFVRIMQKLELMKSNIPQRGKRN